MSITAQPARTAPATTGLWFFLWVTASIAVICFALVPTSTWTQALLGVVGLLIVVALRPVAEVTSLRFAMLAVASAMVLRYWVWRATETLPGWDAPVSMAFAVALLVAESYTICVFFLTCFMTADPITRPAAPVVSARDLPTVDVLVPSFNEPASMLAITLAAARNMHYPKHKLRVVLCDDGGTDQRMNHEDPKIAEAAAARRAELQKLCADLGIIYSTRERNDHAKAGNMAAALERLDGELVAVFDADHVPARDFLVRTAGYFVTEDKLFLVQTPHFFLNPDPINRNIGLVDRCPPENEMFYGHTHRGLDRWDGTFFCGSAALIRRSALDSVGGFSGETITEDAETALDIHAAGWKSFYVNRAMIAGLQPESFVSFIQQRGRWATGMMQMLLLKNPLMRRGLGATQRLCYINSMSFWFFPVIRMVFLIAPLLYLFFGLEIFVATYSEVIAYTITYTLVSFVVQNALFNKTRWPLISELYETAQAPYLSNAVVRTFLSPRAAKFQVTTKDETLAEDLISPIARPLLVLFVLLAAGVVMAGVRYTLFPGDREVLLIVGGWALFNFVIVGAALQCIHEKRQRRGAPRVEMAEPADLALAGSPERSMRGTVLNASNSGVRVRLPLRADMHPSQVVEGATVAFRPLLEDAPGLSHPIKGSVRWSRKSGDEVILGVEFTNGQPWIAAETIAHMIYGRSSRWAHVRERYFTEMGLLGGIAYVVRLSIRGIFRTGKAVVAEPERRRRAAQGAEPIVVELDELTAPLPVFEDYVDPVSANAGRAKEDRARQSDTAAAGLQGGDPRFVLPASMVAGE